MTTPQLPELSEYVVVTIRKLMPYGAFCSLDEYGDKEAFIHISELSRGWIRNIRDHVKEGQKTVCKVIRLDPEKNQVDLSLKSVTEADKKRKMEAYQSQKRADKLLERAALKLKKTIEEAQKEAANPLAEEYGDLYSALEAISKDEIPKSKIPKPWLTAITEVAKKEIRPKQLSQRLTLTLQSYSGSGANKIRETLKKVEDLATKDVKIQIHYLGAPTYYIDSTSYEYKNIEKTKSKIEELLEKNAKKEDYEYAIEENKK